MIRVVFVVAADSVLVVMFVDSCIVTQETVHRCKNVEKKFKKILKRIKHGGQTLKR